MPVRMRRKLVIADIRTHAIMGVKCIRDLANETGNTKKRARPIKPWIFHSEAMMACSSICLLFA